MKNCQHSDFDHEVAAAVTANQIRQVAGLNSAQNNAKPSKQHLSADLSDTIENLGGSNEGAERGSNLMVNMDNCTQNSTRASLRLLRKKKECACCCNSVAISFF